MTRRENCIARLPGNDGERPPWRSGRSASGYKWGTLRERAPAPSVHREKLQPASSYKYSSQRRARPNGDKPDYQAKHHIEQSRHGLTFLNGPERFIFKGRKRRVSADKSNWNQITLILAGCRSGEQHQNETDEKRAAHVDHERAVGKPHAQSVSDISSEAISGDCPSKTPDSNCEVFQQNPGSSLSDSRSYRFI